jgi:hypothetical protein
MEPGPAPGFLLVAARDRGPGIENCANPADSRLDARYVPPHERRSTAKTSILRTSDMERPEQIPASPMTRAMT